MGSTVTMELWMNSKIEFEDTWCVCCNALIERSENKKEFLRNFQKSFGNYTEANGEININKVTVFFKDSSVYEDEPKSFIKGYDYLVAWIVSGNWNLSNIEYFLALLKQLTSLYTFLRGQFPENKFFWTVKSDYDDIMIPFTKLE